MPLVPPTRSILHLDMDAFFASVEQRDHPELRGKPLLIGHDGPRGVVATASYETRPFGCHSAQPMAVAKRLCPKAIVLPVRMEAYHAASERMFAILDEFSPVVEPLSIDEAFLDLTGTERALGQGNEADLELFIAHSALGHLSPRAIEPARLLLAGSEEDEMNGEQWDLRYHLVAATTLLGDGFPEYEKWHREAVATNYGWTKLRKRQPVRLADVLADRPGRETKPPAAYQLKITLKDVKPAVWRRVLVADCTLDDLHRVIQKAMGWESYHLYAFKIGHSEFTHPEMDEGELNMQDATATLLSDVIEMARQKFLYTYDFGDNWRHEVLVEKIGPTEPGQRLPVCLKGSRACPPEDVGGPWGYSRYLEAMANPEHERHDEMMDWRGEFDPEAFDLPAANRELKKTFR